MKLYLMSLIKIINLLYNNEILERFSVGQNIAFMGTTGNVNTIKVESMVQMWYDEVKDFSRDQVKRFT